MLDILYVSGYRYITLHPAYGASQPPGDFRFAWAHAASPGPNGTGEQTGPVATTGERPSAFGVGRAGRAFGWSGSW
jgi:hypothetical protein